MRKNKNTLSQYMRTGIKNKSKPGEKLNLDSVSFLDEPELLDLSVSELETKKKKKKDEKNKKKKNPPTTRTYLDSLPLCKTEEEVEGWLHHNITTFQELALKSALKKKLRSDLFDGLDALVTSQGVTSEPILLDPGIQLAASHQLRDSFVAVSGVSSSEVEVASVTIIDGQFETSDHDTQLDLHGIKESSRRILSKMSPNYFAVVEIALFNSPKHPTGGRLVSLHVHALIWDIDVVAKAQTIANTVNKTITPNATGAKPVVIKWVDRDPVNLARATAYLVKSPNKCKTFYPGKNGKPGNTHHSRKPDRPIRYLRLAEIRSMLTFKDVTFASGDGLPLRSGIAKSLSLLAQEQARKAPRRFHPSEIPSFWCKLKVSMGTTRFNLPIIKRTK